DDGDVTQANTARSGAVAGNLAVVGQRVDQDAWGGKAGQRAANRVGQHADAQATTEQLIPVNANLPTTDGRPVAPALEDDPSCGCGAEGPGRDRSGGGDVDQANTATSGAKALNVALVGQAIGQRAAAS